MPAAAAVAGADLHRARRLGQRDCNPSADAVRDETCAGQRAAAAAAGRGAGGGSAHQERRGSEPAVLDHDGQVDLCVGDAWPSRQLRVHGQRPLHAVVSLCLEGKGERDRQRGGCGGLQQQRRRPIEDSEVQLGVAIRASVAVVAGARRPQRCGTADAVHAPLVDPHCAGARKRVAAL